MLLHNKHKLEKITNFVKYETNSISVDCKTVWANLITGDIRGAPVSSSWQQLRPGCASVKTAQLQPVVQPPWPTMSWRAKDACQCVRDICPWYTT